MGGLALRKVAGGLIAAAAAPTRLLIAVEASLRNLDRIAAGVDAMHGEFLGMRQDIRGLAGQVEVLTSEVATLEPPIEGICSEMPKLNARVEGMDTRLKHLADDLRPIGAFAARFAVGRGRRGGNLPPTVESKTAEAPPPPELPR